MDGNIFLRVFCPEVSGQAGLKRIPSLLRFTRSSALAFPRIHAFLFAAGFLLGSGMEVRGSEGGFPLRRKLTEFNAVMLSLVSFHSSLVVTAHLAGNEPIAVWCLGHCCLARSGLKDSPSDIRPRAFPLWLLAPRLLRAVLFLAFPACSRVLGQRLCLGRGRNPLPSFGLLLVMVIWSLRFLQIFSFL
jgi:hypothetical protein